MLRSNNANNTTIGATPNFGILTAGTAGSTGPTELVVNANQGTFTINSAIVDTNSTAGALSGAGQITTNPNATVALVKGLGNLTLGGTNTYTGGTYVNAGTLTLATGTTNASIVGNVTLNFANLTEGAAQQFATNANFTTNGGGVITLVGANTMGSLAG